MEAANSIPGVKAAATGELKVTGLEVKTVPELSGGDSVTGFCVSDVTCQSQVWGVSSQCQSSRLLLSLFMLFNPQMLSDHFGRFRMC